MKHLVALAVLALSTAAHAVCAPAAAGAAVTATSKATPVVWENSPVGAAAVWWCSDGFNWTQSTYVLRWDAATPALLSAVLAVGYAPDKVAAISATASQYATTPLSDPSLQEVLAPALARIAEAKPTDPVYAVKTNGATATRAAYNIVAGALVIDAKKRAPVGEVCDCATRLIQAGNAYCTVPSIAPEVAYCGAK